jgi:hypothetical protein
LESRCRRQAPRPKPNDWATALADVKLAQAVPDPTPFDTYKINQFLAVVSINLKDYATAATATEAAADSPAMPDTDKTDLQERIHSRLKHQAIRQGGDSTGRISLRSGRSTIRPTSSSRSTTTNLKDIAHMRSNTRKRRSTTPRRPANPDANAADRSERTGQPEQSGGAEASLEAIVLADPDNSADSWRDLVDLAIGTKGLKDIDAIYLFRLKLMAGAMTDADDYTTLASVANNSAIRPKRQRP